MSSFLILLLVLPAVFSTESKCPEGFTLVKRTPTAKNNFTKEWCLGVFGSEDCGNRDYARSICNNNKASISLPESREELQLISNVSRLSHDVYSAIDGQISPRCIKKYIQKFFSFKTVEGECNIKNQLFTFEDANTDPTFVFSLLPNYPNKEDGHRFNDTTPFVRAISGCLKLSQYWLVKTSTGHSSGGGDARTDYCMGQQGNEQYPKSDEIRSVFCGRPPL
ncbi:unnamed protein product [Caenorhabditis brenneri]